MKKHAHFILFLLCLGLWAVFTLVGVAFAADAVAPATSGVMSGFLTGTVFPLLTALVVGLLSYGLKLFAAKYKLQILADNNDMLMRLASQGIAFAEEKAATYADTKIPLNGNDKLTQAVSYILKAMPKVTPEQAQDAVHAVIATIPGAGATGDNSYIPGTAIVAGASLSVPALESRI